MESEKTYVYDKELYVLWNEKGNFMIRYDDKYYAMLTIEQMDDLEFDLINAMLDATAYKLGSIKNVFSEYCSNGIIKVYRIKDFILCEINRWVIYMNVRHAQNFINRFYELDNRIIEED